MNSRVFFSAGWSVLAGLAFCASAWGAAPLLLRNPSLGEDRIAFLYGGDIWTVARQGGDARRLTSAGEVSAGPYFSPDGSHIAYSTREQGLTDVYVIGSDRFSGNWTEGCFKDGSRRAFVAVTAAACH